MGKNKGNGSKKGTNIGYQTKSTKGRGILANNGCHDFPDCFTCPFPPDACHFDYERERQRLKILEENGGNL